MAVVTFSIKLLSKIEAPIMIEFGETRGRGILPSVYSMDSHGVKQFEMHMY
jgi:hypothetical protein